ncbi:MAG: hypothetical protein KF789_05990 [Bdellovibrionaceae bacterium]|nr:hypothetical protein [Pseudobdellovibrionaceae bacterium]
MTSPLSSALLTVLISVAALPVMAQGTFGAEFTMTSRELQTAPLLLPTADDDISTEFGRKTLKEFSDRIRAKCPGCQVSETLDRYDLPIYKIRLPDQFSFLLTLDPAVIEIVPDAATVQGFKALETVLDGLVFETGKSLGQVPQSSYGGGHVHIGVDSTFRGNPVLFRNYFVDWLNHPDLMNSFTGSKYNSPTFYDLPSAQEQAMRQVIAEFDETLRKEGFLQNPNRDPARGNQLMEEFARAVQSRVYTKTLISDWTPTEKYQALNVTRLADPKIPWAAKTLELRFFAGQQSVGEFLELIQLFEGRIEFLEKEFSSRGRKQPLLEYQALQKFSTEQTAARLETFARQAGSAGTLLHGSIQSSSLRAQVPLTGAGRCSRVFRSQSGSVAAPQSPGLLQSILKF